MITYKREHHKRIDKALHNFNATFLYENNLIFGGGTRIAMEIDEFRESVDIDIICPDVLSYKAARNETTNTSLGQLVKNDFTYLREIRADRYGIRTFIEIDKKPIKVEIISFADYRLNSLYNTDEFPIPYLDTTSCFITKLLANADRALHPPYKDIIDLTVMSIEWGGIPNSAWKEAQRHYGETPKKQLIKALEHLLENKEAYKKQAINMGINDKWVSKIVDMKAYELLKKFS